MTLGTVVIDEIVMLIERVRLVNEQIHLIGTLRGPCPAIHATSYTVHGEDGRVVYRSMRAEYPVDLPALTPGNTYTVSVRINVVDRTMVGGPMDYSDLTNTEGQQ